MQFKEGQHFILFINPLNSLIVSTATAAKGKRKQTYMLHLPDNQPAHLNSEIHFFILNFLFKFIAHFSDPILSLDFLTRNLENH